MRGCHSKLLLILLTVCGVCRRDLRAFSLFFSLRNSSSKEFCVQSPAEAALPRGKPWEQAGPPQTPAAPGAGPLPAASPATSDSQSEPKRVWRGLKSAGGLCFRPLARECSWHWAPKAQGFIPSSEQCPSGAGTESQLPRWNQFFVLGPNETGVLDISYPCSRFSFPSDEPNLLSRTNCSKVSERNVAVIKYVWVK